MKIYIIQEEYEGEWESSEEYVSITSQIAYYSTMNKARKKLNKIVLRKYKKAKRCVKQYEKDDYYKLYFDNGGKATVKIEKYEDGTTMIMEDMPDGWSRSFYSIVAKKLI